MTRKYRQGDWVEVLMEREIEEAKR